MTNTTKASTANPKTIQGNTPTPEDDGGGMKAALGRLICLEVEDDAAFLLVVLDNPPEVGRVTGWRLLGLVVVGA